MLYPVFVFCYDLLHECSVIVEFFGQNVMTWHYWDAKPFLQFSDNQSTVCTHWILDFMSSVETGTFLVESHLQLINDHFWMWKPWTLCTSKDQTFPWKFSSVSREISRCIFVPLDINNPKASGYLRGYNERRAAKHTSLKCSIVAWLKMFGYFLNEPRTFIKM